MLVVVHFRFSFAPFTWNVVMVEKWRDRQRVVDMTCAMLRKCCWVRIAEVYGFAVWKR